MIPIKIQNIQMGALSADKAFQSLKHLPQNHQRIFEAEVQKQMEESQERTEAAEKSEKSRIQDEKEQKEKQNGEDEAAEKKLESKSQQVERKKNIIEKNDKGQIEHLDVKI